ncbi:MAG: dihydrofolate reductase family protein [Solirubrobacteraceae bacterium]|jgi:dihydrofolate reductase
MSKLRLSISMSLDGYVGGPNQSAVDPLGAGGMALHDWFFPLKQFREMHGEEGGEINASSAVVEERRANIGATIMGRNMFGPIRGPWPDGSWRGWWGEDPPYHHPVFVLTHHAREPLAMSGATTFHFVGDGIESALAQASAAAKGQDIWLAGGASVVNQYLAARLVNEIDVSIAPVILGDGERLFAGLEFDSLRLKQIRAVDAPGVTHIKYEVG